MKYFNLPIRNFYSKETAMVHSKNDLLSALDYDNVILVVCLDLSTTFDMADHGWSEENPLYEPIDVVPKTVKCGLSPEETRTYHNF